MGVLSQPINALANGFNNFIEGVGDFFENLIDSLGSWIDSIGQWFENLGNDIGSWFENLGNDIGSWIESVIDGIISLGNDIGTWFEGIGDKITQFAENFSNAMNNFMSYLDPTSDNFFLKLAFIPSDGFIPAKFNEVKVEFDNRLPIIGTLTELFNSITQAQSVQSTKPKFEIELPGKWGGQKVEVINFDIIDPYIPYVKTFIRFLIWIPFIIKIYRRLPQIIY